MTCPDCNYELKTVTPADATLQAHWCPNCGGQQLELEGAVIEYMRPLLSKYREGEK